jgi:hypothetical protein
VGNGIDENHRAERLEESISEIEAADAVVHEHSSGRQWMRSERADDFAAEAVIAEKDVADARDQCMRMRRLIHATSSPSGSTSSG